MTADRSQARPTASHSAPLAPSVTVRGAQLVYERETLFENLDFAIEAGLITCHSLLKDGVWHGLSVS